MTKSEKILRYSLGLFVLLAGLVAYGLTVAPTLSFWDCGEFIAAAACLGIPHPPGAPLYVMIGRIFTLLPLGEDIGYRVNLISVISSAFTGLMGVFIVLKLFELWWPGSPNRFWKYLAAVSGALILDFSNTFWSSAVEAEVYGVSMFMTLLLIYLTLRWYEARRPYLDSVKKGAEENGFPPDRYLILIAYLGLLSTAVHMTTFLVMPLIFVFVTYSDPEKRTDLRFWVAGGSLLIILAVIEPFLIATGLWLVISAAAYFTQGKAASWRLAALLTFFGLLGFSAQLYIPIRSSQNPSLDENNPNTWEKFKSFLERKQYGDQSMLTRMRTRRAEWSNQFGRHPRMGFWGFFEEQYGKGGWAFLPVFMLGMMGLLLPFRRDKRIALFLLAIVLAGTIGLVLYMNFADGTRIDRYGEAGLEVRDRDYFWTPGFITFALAIGIGLGFLGMFLSSEEARQKMKAPLRLALSGLLVLAAGLIPALELKANFIRNSRAGNYLPYDYAYNLLISCDKDALLFTNGDNDTFPLWCLQEAYGFRKDARVINLSLLNTDWYILQLKNRMNVPISLADSQIVTKNLPLPGSGQLVPRPEYPYFDKRRGISHFLMPVQLDNQVLRVQDFMVEDIAITNDFKYPFFFSRTVPSSARVGLDANLKTEAMVLRLLREKTENGYDLKGTEKLLWNTYRYQGFDNPEITLDDNEAGMMIAFPEIAIELYYQYLQRNDTSTAVAHLEKGVRKFPFYPRSLAILVDFYRSKNQPAKASNLLGQSRGYLERAVHRSPDNPIWWLFLSNLYHLENRKIEAYQAVERSAELNPAEDFIFRTQIQYYLTDNRPEEALKAAQRRLGSYPNDPDALQVVNQLGGIPPSSPNLPSR